MPRNLSITVTLLTLVSIPLSNAAIAGVGYNAGGVVELLNQTSQLNKGAVLFLRSKKLLLV